MHFKTLIFCLLTLFSVVSAYAIPFRRVRIAGELHKSPSQNAHAAPERRHRPFVVKRQQSTITLGTISPTNSPSAAPTTATTSQPASSSSSSSASAPSLTAASNSQPSQPPTNGSTKYVVAHHMVGNTFPYTVQDWADDIALAHASGIDGFALNMGTDDWQPARVSDAYQAAQQSNLDFKLFLSLDMSYLLPLRLPNDAQNLRNLVNSYASHPNQLQYDSRAFVSTFAGESCNFGQGSVPDGWKNQFTQHPDLQGKIYFVPAFFIDPTTFKDFADVMDGDFNWNSGWPIQVTTSFAQNALSQFNSSQQTTASPFSHPLSASVSSVLSNMQLALSQFIGSTATDEQHLSGLAALSGAIQARDGQSSKRAYMGAVSPWFFTHYGPDSFNKNFIYLSDQHLYSKRWESLISSRDQFDVVEVLTWNDYGDQAWTDGMNHTAWLELTQYYSTAFKTGQYPEIQKDKIFMWSRPHSTNAQSPDPVPQPTNFQLFEDAVWAVVLTTAPSTVTLSTSSNSNDSKTFQVPAGLSKLAIPITPGGTMKGVIERDGQTIVELNPTDFTFQGSPQTYNFNAFVASATAE
ncbi:glycosyl hydrolase family 71-domain-containing protein [Flammula alnicola]|nr:glycosyl hydrolase family 71-domain-containing protein [Flammula alnicola]